MPSRDHIKGCDSLMMIMLAFETVVDIVKPRYATEYCSAERSGQDQVITYISYQDVGVPNTACDDLCMIHCSTGEIGGCAVAVRVGDMEQLLAQL